MVSLEFHDPSGVIEVKQPHAPRLATLEGTRIGFVSNEQWQAYRMLPRLKALLEADVPGIEVLPIDAFPQGNAVIGSEETAAHARGEHPIHAYLALLRERRLVPGPHLKASRWRRKTQSEQVGLP